MTLHGSHDQWTMHMCIIILHDNFSTLHTILYFQFIGKSRVHHKRLVPIYNGTKVHMLPHKDSYTISLLLVLCKLVLRLL